MNELDALLAGIVAHPHETVRWLVLADWLRDHEQPDRAELVHYHRELIRTCLAPEEHLARGEWQARVVQLIDSGVTICTPRLRLPLPNGATFEGVFIPPGSFRMGGSGNADETPLHEVTISEGFYMGMHPVTDAVWVGVMGTTPHSPPRTTNQPLVSVGHRAAEAFCVRFRELTGWAARLPTEAEWEYACRAGTTTAYHWGDEPQPHRFRCGTPPYRPSGLGEAIEVGTFPPSPWGLFDCHGNVAEWCQDVYAANFYTHWPATDPVCLEGDADMRVCRGGAWNRAPERCTASRRGSYPPDSEYDTLGFRVVVETSPPDRPA